MPSTPEAPTECLPEGLKSVLADLGARFGPLTLVSTTHLHTDNHSPGSARAKMHEACSAVDFKVAGASQPVVAYLKKRPEVNGINLYRNNGVIHIDASGPPKAARSATQQDDEAEVARPKPRPRTARPGSGTTEAGNAARGSRTEKAAPIAADDSDQPDVTSTKSVTKGAAAKRRASRVVPRAPTASRNQQTEYEKAFDSQGNPRNGPASE